MNFKSLLLKLLNRQLKFIFHLLAFICFVFADKTNAQTRQPNIILILGDDVGYKTLTCDGGNLYSTPNIDSLAKNGMRFTQCHASPLCSPSRFMLLTGKYNFRNYFKWGVMDTSQKTIANMFKDAGYKTGCFGKWQLSGGDESIRKFGFDEYAVHDALDSSQRMLRYKDPHIYTHGGFLPDSLIINKYGPDIVSDSLMSFIDANKSNPFFIYYPMILVHQPFSPTPNDSAFASWDPYAPFDTTFFPSMMSYMDNEIGELINKLKQLNIEKNTVIIFSGDNGTPKFAADYEDDDSIRLGKKGSTTEAGTRVPLIVYWPNTVEAGSVNRDLIDFTDFFPTLAGIANLPKPVNYGILDGVDFSPILKGKTDTARSWIFDYYDHDPSKPPDTTYRWAQTHAYKLYDTSSAFSLRLFYNIKTDPDEQSPIPDSLLTPHQASIKQQLLDVINGYTMQGVPLLSNPIVAPADSFAVINDAILIDGGSTVTSSGYVWSTKPNPDTSSLHTTDTAAKYLSEVIGGLKSEVTYYTKAYAINYAGIAYSNQVSFKTLLHTPVATAATSIDSNKFVANWTAVNDATHYRLEVSTSPVFSVVNHHQLKQPFNNGRLLPPGWTVTFNVIENDSIYGKASPSMEFTSTHAQIVTKPLKGPVTELKFWIQGLNTDTASALRVQGFNGANWVNIENIKKLPHTGETKDYTAVTAYSIPPNITQIRFKYKKSVGTVVLDDIFIAYDEISPSFVKTYKNIDASKTFKLVTGLNAGTNYYYRVNAANDDDSSAYSNIISACTCTDSTNKVNGNNSEANTIKAIVFPNPTSGVFNVDIASSADEAISIEVFDVNGKKVYQSPGKTNETFVFGKQFTPGIYVLYVEDGNKNYTFKLIKTK